MRSFIGVPLQESVRRSIYQKFSAHRKEFPEIKWVEEENLHITLKFLDEIEEKQIEIIKQIISETAKRSTPFSLKTTFLNGFPNISYPRVLWMGVFPQEPLLNLYQFLETELVKIGFPSEKRKFHAHITVGRVKRRLSFPHNKILNFEENISVTELAFYKSELTRQGSIYTILASYPFYNE